MQIQTEMFNSTNTKMQKSENCRIRSKHVCKANRFEQASGWKLHNERWMWQTRAFKMEQRHQIAYVNMLFESLNYLLMPCVLPIHLERIIWFNRHLEALMLSQSFVHAFIPYSLEIFHCCWCVEYASAFSISHIVRECFVAVVPAITTSNREIDIDMTD